MFSSLKWKAGAAILLLSFSVWLTFDGLKARQKAAPDPPAEPREPSIEQTALLDALEDERRLLTAYRDAHGCYPEIVQNPAWRAGVLPSNDKRRVAFAERTDGGTLLFAVVSDREKTLRLVGVRGGAKMEDREWRDGLLALSRGNKAVALFEFNGEPYAGSTQVFIPIDSAAERDR